MKLKHLIKPLISLLMLAAIYRIVHPETLLQTLLAIPWPVIVGVTLAYAAGQVFNYYKWWILSRVGNVGASYPTAIKSYFIGMFVNSFGLGTIGGDLSRAILLAAGRPTKTAAIASVVADRALGLAVLAFIGVISAFLFGIPNVDQHWIDVLVIIGLSVIIAWWIGPKVLLRFIRPDHPLRAKAVAIAGAFPKDKSTLALLVVLSATLHLWQMGLHWVMGMAFGLNLPLVAIMVAVPFVNMFASLPLSWNGLGVREAGYIFFLTPLPLTREQAVAFGAIWLLAVTVNSAIGGLLALWTGDFHGLFAKKEEKGSEG